MHLEWLKRGRLTVSLIMLTVMFYSFEHHSVRPVEASTVWVVDDDGSADFMTIQGAVDAAEWGDTVIVRRGIYRENVVVDKALSLIGEGREAVIVDGGGVGTVVRIMVDNVSFSGFTVRNGGPEGPLFDGSGVLVLSSYGVRVSDNVVANCQVGIYLWISMDTLVQENHVANNSFYGILMDYSYGARNVIEGNLVVDNGFGIGLDTSIGHIISNNIVSNSSWHGINMFSGSSYNNVSGNIVTFGLAGGIQVENSVGNTFLGNTVANNTLSGISIWSSSFNLLSENLLKYNLNGVHLAYASNNTLRNNLIGLNTVGIHLTDSEHNAFYHNNFVNNSIQTDFLAVGWNAWDDGYPSGGNYWSDYSGADIYGGLDQDEVGGDGIGDNPYIVNPVNRDRYPSMMPWKLPIEFHDVTLLDVKPSAVEVYLGETIDVTVTVQNKGSFPENFTVRLSAIMGGSEQLLETLDVLNLAPLADATLVFNWKPLHTAVFILKAHIPPLVGEVDATDNRSAEVTVKVKMLGDVNGDYRIDLRDISQAAVAFGSRPSHLDWNRQADVNGDGKVDMRDLVLVARNFGKSIQ